MNPKQTTIHSNFEKQNHTKLFSPTAIQLIESHINFGKLENPDARGIIRGDCGDCMQIDLQLEGDIIKAARYETDGCGATIACGSMITSLIQGKTLSDAELITPEMILSELGGLPSHHEHCAGLAVETLQQTIRNGRKE